ncbi:hypothetical protein ACP70R_033165 [Stipagrostis hirtigluma subsp. patula]
MRTSRGGDRQQQDDHPSILHGDGGEGGDAGGSDAERGQPRQVWVPGPVIVGAGPSGLATAACLKARGVPSLVLEKDACVAASWRRRTYERLRLHLPRGFCELPLAAFPPGTPAYPTRDQFVAYLDAYARAFAVEPCLGARVRSAAYDASIGFWRVTVDVDGEAAATEFVSRWLVVATGENAEPAWPEGVEGMEGYRGVAMHTSSYKRGDEFRGKKVLVVGCGNSGMEVSLDLCNNGAKASMVVRDKVVPAINRLTEDGVEFIDGHKEDFDAIIFATGYKSNVPSWLKEEEFFSQVDGFPKKAFPHSWRGKKGLYAAGFTRKGLMGSSYDALRIAGDIADQWTEALASPTATNRISDLHA